ncbi:hypothetical protein L9F63_011102, partial [Diploptera punctata]
CLVVSVFIASVSIISVGISAAFFLRFFTAKSEKWLSHFCIIPLILDRSCCGRSVRNKLGFLIEPAVKVSGEKVSVSIMTSVLSIVFFEIRGEFSYVAFVRRLLSWSRRPCPF